MRSKFKQDAKQKQKLFEDRFLLNRLDVCIPKETSPIIDIEDLGDYYLVFYHLGNSKGKKLKKSDLSTSERIEINNYLKNFVIKLSNEQKPIYYLANGKIEIE